MKNYPTLGKDQLKLDLQQEIITEILSDKVTILLERSILCDYVKSRFHSII